MSEKIKQAEMLLAKELKKAVKDLSRKSITPEIMFELALTDVRHVYELTESDLAALRASVNYNLILEEVA